MLRIPFALENQMVDVYTCAIFENFQVELWESMKCGGIVKVDDEIQTIYEVQRHVLDMEEASRSKMQKELPDRLRVIVEDKKSDIVSCSCKNFEWEGIPCRHMLHYLIFRKQYTKLSSKYILKRWTKGAKSVKLMKGSGVNMEDGGDRGLLVWRNELY
ncbi:hypothetical protein L1049_024038 [Liquidambar formosana]|uniref:Protein FAR1-RELATED SEQUENCE n=1 Tax=Liquidambar formosana TaxID=63359 RepID=A0AAP0X466_LIQFO